MCIHSKRLVVTCASLLFGVVPGSFAQTRPPAPATPSTASDPALSELPFRLDGYGRTDSGADTRLLPQMHTTVLVKVPLSDYLIDPTTQTDSFTAMLGAVESFSQGLVAAVDGSAFVAQANQLQKGGLCLYDNPTLPVAYSGISWLATTGEHLSDGTALVSLPIDIQSDKLVVGQHSPQVALTRVRCVPSKMMDVSDVVEAAQELQKSLEAETGASGQGSQRFASARGAVDGFTTLVILKRAEFVDQILSNDATVATNVTSDESDAFTAKRVLTLEVVPPDYSTEWGAQWKSGCQTRIGDRVFSFLPESQSETRVFSIEISNANTNSVASTCVVYERSAWSPSDQDPVQEALREFRERLLTGRFVFSGRELNTPPPDAELVFTSLPQRGQDERDRFDFRGTITGLDKVFRLTNVTATCDGTGPRGQSFQVDITCAMQSPDLGSHTASIRLVADFSVDGRTTVLGNGQLIWDDGPSPFMIFELDVLVPTSVESSTSDPTAPSSATTAANVSDKGCSFIDSTFYCEGYDVEVGSVTEYLDEGETFASTADLQRGNYIVTARCDSDCDDIDLGVYDANRTPVVEDGDPDDAPTVRFSVTTRGEYHVGVSMYACSVEPCEFTVGILKKAM